jgi:DNA-binding FadR family transcriptional regulator
VDGFGEANVGWHRQVAHLADNELLEALNEGVALILESGFLIDEFFSEPGSRRATLGAHESIMEAIAAHDPNKAWQAMADHMGSHEHEWDERLGSAVIPIATKQDLPDGGDQAK